MHAAASVSLGSSGTFAAQNTNGCLDIIVGFCPLRHQTRTDGQKPAKTVNVLPEGFVTTKCLIPRGLG
jgi:hypothetical protein